MFDLGAGTLSTAVLGVGSGVYEVVATAGETDLGGDDWDEAIVNWIATEIEEDYGIDPLADSQLHTHLRDAAKQARRTLTSQSNATIALDGIETPETDTIYLERDLSREKLKSLTKDFVELAIDSVKEALWEARHHRQEIDEILLSGRVSSMPGVESRIENLTGVQPQNSIPESVACGAAIKGGVRDGSLADVVVLPVAPLSMGVQAKDGSFEPLIKQNSTIPTEASKTFTTENNNQNSVGIQAFQGEKDTATENRLIDDFQIRGIPPAPAGVPQVDVTFHMDGDGIVSVEAEDQSRGANETVTISGRSGLSDADIESRRDQLPTQMKSIEQERREQQLEAAENVESEPDQMATNANSPTRNLVSREPDLGSAASPSPQSLSYQNIEVGDPIGSGGQGVVYHAEIPGTAGPDQIALKEPQGQNQTINDSIIEAFLEEAQSWEMLATRERQKPRWQDSEYIVGIIATGEKLPWIAMEYMDGGSLDERLADSPNGLPLAEALWVGECLCRGVEIAHNYGIVHLDLKPENILFRETSEGTWDVPKLADWGVSRELAEQTGTVEGLSVRYAAPEQFEPEEFGDPDMLTDIYQVGVLLYTIFTGNAPYTGGQLATMRAIVDGEEPTAPSELREGLPAEIDSIIFKAMSREKGMRYRTIGVLANELHSLRETVSTRD